MDYKPVISLIVAYAERDKLIRRLWCVLNDINSLVKLDDFTDEDLNLWTKVTSHSAMQKQLEERLKP